MLRTFIIGHPSYSGANAFERAQGYAQALRILLKRGADMRGAHRALQGALNGSHATCSRMATLASGRRVGMETIEVSVRVNA